MNEPPTGIDALRVLVRRQEELLRELLANSQAQTAAVGVIAAELQALADGLRKP